MIKDYLYVHKSVLPKCFEQIVQAKHLLENNKSLSVSEAVKEVGISRSTFYKYENFIIEPTEVSSGRNAVISMILNHEPGVLNSVLTCISKAGASVLSINQSLPIRNKANVVISLEIGNMKMNITELIGQIEKTDGAENINLVALE